MESIILDQMEEARQLLSQKNVIDRDVDKDQLDRFLSRPNILAILGVRRCGKSVLSHLILRDREYGYANFDDERFRGMSASGLNDVLEAVYKVHGDVEYLLFDEIQNVEGWELFTNRLRRTKKLIITGSNAKLLSGELATHLTGRYIDIHLYPFSFREYLTYRGFGLKEAYSTREAAKVRSFLDEYIMTGGFPEVLIFGKQMARRIYGDIISKDIVARYDIRNRKSFDDLARYMVSNSGNEYTYSKLSRVFGLKRVETVTTYVEYLESSFLNLTVMRYSPKLKEQMLAPRKVYCIDNGIINAAGFGPTENKGGLMENLVAVELHRRKDQGGLDMDIFYWKDHQQHEVDFVVRQGKKVKELIQVTYAKDLLDVREREVLALEKAGRELGCSKLTVITWGHDGESDGVGYVPLWKWLLG